MFGLVGFSGLLDQDFSEFGCLVVFRIRIRCWIWILLDFQDLDTWFGFGLLWIFRIWICSSGFGFGFFLQDIGVDRDTKMLICSAVVPVFRALVVFLRRLVLLSGCLDFGVSSGYGLLIDLIQMYFSRVSHGRALLPDFYRRLHP